jgi:hypothetical protein
MHYIHIKCNKSKNKRGFASFSLLLFAAATLPFPDSAPLIQAVINFVSKSRAHGVLQNPRAGAAATWRYRGHVKRGARTIASRLSIGTNIAAGCQGSAGARLGCRHIVP